MKIEDRMQLTSLEDMGACVDCGVSVEYFDRQLEMLDEAVRLLRDFPSTDTPTLREYMSACDAWRERRRIFLDGEGGEK